MYAQQVFQSDFGVMINEDYSVRIDNERYQTSFKRNIESILFNRYKNLCYQVISN